MEGAVARLPRVVTATRRSGAPTVSISSAALRPHGRGIVEGQPEPDPLLDRLGQTGRELVVHGALREVHTNAELMRASPYGERLVHGALVVSLVTGLRSRTGLFDDSIVALAEIRSWRFAAPVLIGDTIRVHSELVEVREVSAGDRGVVVERVEVRNQREETVQHGELVMMHRRRRSA